MSGTITPGGSPSLTNNPPKTSRFSGTGGGVLGKLSAAAQVIAPVLQAAAPYAQEYFSSNSRNAPQPQNNPSQQADPTQQSDPQDTSVAKQMARQGFEYFKANRRPQTEANLYNNSHLSMEDMQAGANGTNTPFNGMAASHTPYSDAIMSSIGMGGLGNSTMPPQQNMMYPPQLQANGAGQMAILALAATAGMGGAAPFMQPQGIMPFNGGGAVSPFMQPQGVMPFNGGGAGGMMPFGQANAMAPYMTQNIDTVTHGIAPNVPQTQFTTNQFSDSLAANASLYGSLTPDMSHSQIAQAQALRTTFDVLSGGAAFGAGAFGGYGIGAGVGSPFVGSQVGVAGTPYF